MNCWFGPSGGGGDLISVAFNFAAGCEHFLEFSLDLSNFPMQYAVVYVSYVYV